MSRWGGDRICPNGPDEGGARLHSGLARERKSKSDSESPKGGFAPIRGWFFSCLYTNSVHEIELHLTRRHFFS